MIRTREYTWTPEDIRTAKANLAEALRANNFDLAYSWEEGHPIVLGPDSDVVLVYVQQLRHELLAWCEADGGAEHE
jgi:hypothetical protein